MKSAPRQGATPACILTIDVEDWFHLLEHRMIPERHRWDALPSRVEQNFLRLLDLLESHQARSTCFFLGWVAARFPHLVKEAARRGHDVASHGMDHKRPVEMTRTELELDLRSSKAMLEDISGKKVEGYRAAGFALPDDTRPFFEMLAQSGYRYDSSIFPARHRHGGQPHAELGPRTISTPSGPVTEFPISVLPVLGRRWCLFGGGYFRVAPFALVRRGAHSVLHSGRPLVLYLHPREIDPGQPRLPLGFTRGLRAYVNLHRTEPKLNQLLGEFSFRGLESQLDHSPQPRPQPAVTA